MWLARLRRGLLAALVTASVVVPVSAAAGRPATSAPAPPRLPAVAADTLQLRYEANHAGIAEAARMAERYGNEARAEALRAMAEPGRDFLSFDGRGDGRAVEVIGDLAAADRIAVLVPGADTTLDTYDHQGPGPYASVGGGARALHEELRRQAPDARVAVVAWLGYDAPDTISPQVATTDRAEQGADRLRGFVGSLQRANPRAEVALLCHSYGSVVCGRAAAHGLSAADIAVFGSPGLGASSAADLSTGARLWAARGADDWIANVPNADVRIFDTTIGFGVDPTTPGFGARAFAAGPGGHSDYLKPGSTYLHNLARIALGHASEVSHG
jgi:Alpha/beta hydrolase